MTPPYPPDISVVMSVYNGARYLQSAIDSILKQAGISLEVVVVNDGSTDDTAAILEQYVRQDARIRIFEQHNSGLTLALIQGCAVARGRYIARQDVGDTSLPGRLMTQKAALDENEALSFVSCWTEFVGPGGEFLFLGNGTGKAARPISILSREATRGVIDGPSCHPSVMFRKEAYERVGGYRKEFYFGQDWDLWYRLAEVGQFQMIQDTLYRASITPGSISGHHRAAQERLAALAHGALVRRMDRESDEDIVRHAASIRDTASHGASRRAEAAWLYFIGECLRRNGDPHAPAYLWKSVCKNPLTLKPWIRLAQLTPSLVGRLKAASPE